MTTDLTQDLQQRIVQAASTGEPVEILGGGSKRFYGRAPSGTLLEVGGHRGIVNYEPVELVVSARAGTPLRQLEQTLFEQNQMLAFEPPHFADTTTLGGAIAAGLSGPRRMTSGAARDFVLGCTLINGKGELLRFGGEVMKNVAGYDVSRLMTGACGTLAVLLDISLKVLPRPESEMTLVFELDTAEAIRQANRWAAQPLPVTATCHHNGQLYLRLSGATKAVTAAAKQMGGEQHADMSELWSGLRDQTHSFFADAQTLWRLSVPPASGPLLSGGEWLYEWCGAQRWLKTDATAEQIRAAAARAGGHATMFRTPQREGDVFHPLPAKIMSVHQALKRAFDPRQIFNPGRMYAEL
ncbi:MAG: glycolate oxidase [Gammaproteobacteria bacterium SG8_47]|nr:MAG: glycolate oxidase [Gammaproteobacteria bacterium SG8_47]